MGWRFLSRALPWLAPAWLFAACGGTVERARDDANATGGAAGTSKGGSRSDQPAGGSTLLPMPVAGRGGTSMMVEGGSGGTLVMLPPGVSDMPKSVSCTPIEHCSSAAIGPVFIDPCCTEEASCGLDTSVLALTGAAFRDSCQAKAQPGVRDTTCPDSAPMALPFPAGETTVMVPLRGNLGCCRDDGKCGVLVDELSSPVLGVVSKLGLGCVDSAPFFNGMPAADCGTGGESFGGAPNGGWGGDAAAGMSAGGAG